MDLCEYGCGQEAKYQLKNGKWCCSKSQNSCARMRKKHQLKMKEKWALQEIREMYIKAKTTPEAIDKQSKLMKEIWSKPGEKKKRSEIAKEYHNRPEVGEKKSKIMKEVMNRPEVKEKISRIISSLETRKKTIKTCLERYGLECVGQLEKVREGNRQRMLNGGAVKAIKGIKNPSKEELKLIEIVEEICRELSLECESQYKILNYSVDVAIIKCKIAIEYDGYYHFDCQENIVHHERRQEEIENLEWRFIRYNIFQKFPTKEQVKEDLEKCIKFS